MLINLVLSAFLANRRSLYAGLKVKGLLQTLAWRAAQKFKAKMMVKQRMALSERKMLLKKNPELCLDAQRCGERQGSSSAYDTLRCIYLMLGSNAPDILRHQ